MEDSFKLCGLIRKAELYNINKIYICDNFTTTYQYFACKHNKQFWNISKKTVNTRLGSKLILAKCRKILICLENTSHNIFLKYLKVCLLLWELTIFQCQLINVYILQRKQPSWRNQYFPYLHICNFYFVLKLKTYCNLTEFSS